MRPSLAFRLYDKIVSAKGLNAQASGDLCITAGSDRVEDVYKDDSWFLSG